MKATKFYLKKSVMNLLAVTCMLLLFVLTTPYTKAATIISQNFSSTSGYTASGWTRSNGGNYTCSAGDYAIYSNLSSNNLYLSNFHVPQGKGVKISFNHKYYSNTSRTITVYARVGGYAAFNSTNKHYNSWMQVSGPISISSTTCTTATVDISGNIVGGQDLCILFVASNTNVCIDNIIISDDGPAASVPNIASTPYTKTFDEPTTSTFFYGPFSATSDFYLSSASNNVFSYRTNYGNNNMSGAYTRINSTGGNNGKVNSSTSGYCIYISSTTADVSNKPAPSGNPCFITKELNTSTCSGSTATLRFAFRQIYSGGSTYDEDYKIYCPRIFYAITTDGTAGYSWTQATVNYYFPNGQWWYATTSLPKAKNVIVAFCTGTATGYYYFDDIKILCKDCNISGVVGGAISCTSHPDLTEYLPNTDYTFTIGATPYATHYKWMIRDLTTSTIYSGTSVGLDPAVVSGQGTQTATINFGTVAGTNYRVICLPYDSDYGTDASPTDACYAKISYYQTLSEGEIIAPITLLNFSTKCLNNHILISWSTATETNNDYFVVQQSLDAQNFEDIAIIKGAGNTNIKQNYKLEVPETSETVYYRLKQIDFDGNSETFEIIHADCNENANSEITTYPNPFDGKILYLNSTSNLENAVINIYDALGRLVQQTNYNEIYSHIELKIDTQLEPGAYYLEISSKNELNKRISIIVK